MQATFDKDAEVVVIGAGPVGLVTSLLLARQGHRIALIERFSAPYPLPRAIGMSHESLRILHWAGATDRLKAALMWDERLTHADFVASDGEVLLTMPFRARAESGWPEMQAFNQPDAEALLEEQVRSNPAIRVFRGHVATSLRQDVGGVQVDVGAADASGAPAPDGTRQSLRADYIVGCDGANSMVRQSLGLPMVDLGFAYDWLVVDIEPTTEREWSPYLGQALGPRRPVTWAPSGPGRRRFEFMLMPGESREAMGTAEAAWRLLAECDVTPASAKLVRHAMYTFRGMWAEQWRQGRVLLAGDAAHLTPPFLGQGLNSGLRDAATLAWRLDLVLRGHVPADTLDDYGRERGAHVRLLIEQAVEKGRLICVTDPQDCEERDGMLRFFRDNPEQLPPMPAWRMGPGALLADDDQAGLLARQGVVRAGGSTGMFDDVCGVGRFVLLARQGDPARALSDSSRKAWERLGGLAVHVGADAPVHDIENTYGAWFDEIGAEVILVRPDFYVFGTAPTLAGSDRLVQQLAEQLRLPTNGSH
jgi:2-polyprenyl-6-methoxyphenol hydroxylase-like FAD-dependent oxidoreductase